jgi:hypothetical protein
MVCQADKGQCLIPTTEIIPLKCTALPPFSKPLRGPTMRLIKQAFPKCVVAEPLDRGKESSAASAIVLVLLGYSDEQARLATKDI